MLKRVWFQGSGCVGLVRDMMWVRAGARAGVWVDCMGRCSREGVR